MIADQLAEEIAAEDKLLDVLGSATPHFDLDDKLAGLLLTWRITNEADPMPELVDADTGVAVITCAARKRARSKAIAAAALIAFVLAVLGLALIPITSWWYLLPAVGVSGLGGAYAAVARMRDEQWTAAELADENGASR